MKTSLATVIKTGNSYALRVPKSYAERNNLRPGAKVMLPDPKAPGGTLADLNAAIHDSLKKDKITTWGEIQNPAQWQQDERATWKNQIYVKRVVIDTNILISWYKAGALTVDLDLSSFAPVFSVVTEIEALGFKGITKSESTTIQAILNIGELSYVDEVIALRTITLRQQHKIKTPDAIIAATALIHDTELWTANTADFKSIPGLKLFNPFESKR